MPDINPSIPVVGQPDSTEEPKVVTALTQLVAAVNDVDSAQILDRSVAAVDIENQQAWQTVALTGSAGVWAPTTISYMKDSLGFVHFRGDVSFSSGTVAAGATVFTLPVGYRPVTTVAVACLRCFPTGTFSGVGLTISAAGVVSHSNGLTAGEGLSLGGMTFRAEN